jgi:LysM repeat protein
MGFEKVEFQFPHESEDGEIEIEDTNAVEIDLSGKKTEDEYRAEQEPEVEVEEEDALEIELVDDTPKADQGREASEPPEDVTEEELEGYSSKVKKRINKIQKGYHDERRAKEAAEREREEAVRAAQHLVEENKRLKGVETKNKEMLLEQAKRQSAVELLVAKKQYKDAYDAGDSDKVVEAQEKITTAKIKADKIENFTPEPLQEESNEASSEYVAPQPVDTKLQEWIGRNPWFQQDDEMKETALAYHTRIVKQGADPATDEYYEQIDARMREIFPDQFEDAPKKKRANVVAPATRSTAPKKVKLNQSQQRLAKKFGLTYEQYARQMIIDSRND